MGECCSLKEILSLWVSVKTAVPDLGQHKECTALKCTAQKCTNVRMLFVTQLSSSRFLTSKRRTVLLTVLDRKCASQKRSCVTAAQLNPCLLFRILSIYCSWKVETKRQQTSPNPFCLQQTHEWCADEEARDWIDSCHPRRDQSIICCFSCWTRSGICRVGGM